MDRKEYHGKFKRKKLIAIIIYFVAINIIPLTIPYIKYNVISVASAQEVSKKEFLDFVRQLIARGLSANSRVTNGNPFSILAAYQGNLEAIKFLLDKGADINIQDQKGRTALMYAASKGHPEIVRFLLENGADISIKDQHGYTTFLWPFFYVEESIIDVLTDAYDDKETSGVRSEYTEEEDKFIDAAIHGRLKSLKTLKKSDLKIKGAMGIKALGLASYRGHMEVVKFLLDNHVPVDGKDFNGITALMRVSEQSNIYCALSHESVPQLDAKN